jgi:hypothetical protein
VFGSTLAQFPTPVPSPLEISGLVALRSSNPSLKNFVGWNATDPLSNTTQYCNWYGVTCGSSGITQLILENVGLTNIPAAVYSSFPNLAIFRLDNNSISTPIPQTFSIGSSRLTINKIDISNNSISGPIPPNLFESGIILLNLANNQFSGSIPSSVGNAINLWDLNLANNQLSGPLPSTIVNLKQLDTFNVSNNMLNGSLPSTFGNLTQLNVVDLSYNNFTGPIPDFTFALSSLSAVYLQGNHFDGLVPNYLSFFVGTADLTGVSFRCPIPQCAPGRSCVLSGVTCTCPCNSTGGGYCVPGSLACSCQSFAYGSLCTSQCVGVISTAQGFLPCNGHGTCNNGPNGDGTCTCYSGYGGKDCSITCPGAPNNTCSGLGTCNLAGFCECFGNRGGVNCYGCAFGWAGPTCEVQCRGGNTVCSGNGACNDGPLGDGNCNCYSGWQGAACEIVLPQQASHVNPWLVFGIIIIILFVFALAVIAVAVFYWWQTSKNYKLIESKYKEAVTEREVEEIKSKMHTEKEKRSPSTRINKVDLQDI